MRIIYTCLDSIEYADVASYAALLPAARQEKIARLRFDADKLLSMAAGLLIRRAVGDSPIAVQENGKPYAPESGVHFSVSHSGRCTAIAVDSVEVGLDVEKLLERDFMKIARRFYHPNELAFVENAADPARAFTHVWTRKEAYVKQLGVGVATDLKAFDTTEGELYERIRSFDVGEYVLSVCANVIISKENINISELELNDLLSTEKELSH